MPWTEKTTLSLQKHSVSMHSHPPGLVGRGGEDEEEASLGRTHFSLNAGRECISSKASFVSK